MGKRDFLILTATKKEKKAILSHSHIQKLFKNEGVEIISTGIGEKSLKLIEQIQFKNYEFTINAGVCGSVNLKIQLFETIIPSKITITNNTQKKIQLTIPEKLCCEKCSFTLGTTPYPIFSKKEKEKLFSSGIDIIDMECFFIAEKNPNVIPIKVVTDTVKTEENLKKHLENIGKGLDILKNQTAEIIKKLSNL